MAATAGVGQALVSSCKNDPALSVTWPLAGITGLVMAILGMHGVVSPVALGATMMGVGGVTIAAMLFSSDHTSAYGKCLFIIKELVGCILFGALATAGVLSAFTTGWVYTGIWIAGATCFTGMMGLAWCTRKDMGST